MYKQLVLVEFKNTAPFLYEIVSDKEITVEAVADYFRETEGWSEERDNIMFIDEPTQIKL